MAQDVPSPQGRQLTAELEVARASFHSVVDHLPDSSWAKTSANPPWTNGQVLFHITLAFILLPFLLPLAMVFGRLPSVLSKLFAGLLDLGTGLFNWANGLGPRAGGLVFSRTRLLRKYDSLHLYAVNSLSRLAPSELQREMFYPRKWDPMFRDFMTIADLFRYPVMHMEHHLKHIAA